MSIVSPTFGVVTSIKNNKITIYIGIEDNHDIYAPISGKISKIKFSEGEFKRKIFQTYVNKIGRASITINDIKFWIEVGKPKYVTDRVLLEKELDDKVKQGERIGEILLGSLSEVHLPENTIIKVKEGDVLIGGETVVAEYSSNSLGSSGSSNSLMLYYLILFNLIL